MRRMAKGSKASRDSSRKADNLRMDSWAADGSLRFLLPLDKAREKVLQLLERVARGEVEYFAVSLYES